MLSRTQDTTLQHIRATLPPRPYDSVCPIMLVLFSSCCLMNPHRDWVLTTGHQVIKWPRDPHHKTAQRSQQSTMWKLYLCDQEQQVWREQARWKEVAYSPMSFILLLCHLSFNLHIWFSGTFQLMEEKNLKPSSQMDQLTMLALAENGTQQGPWTSVTGYPLIEHSFEQCASWLTSYKGRKDVRHAWTHG